MSRFDGTKFMDFRTGEKKSLEDIRFVVEDRSGDLWLGGRYGVLVRYDGESLVDYSQQLDQPKLAED